MTPPLSDERLAEIRARYESLRATQSKPGLRTATRGERADIRHRLEREIARQDVPLLLSEVDRLRAERERLMATPTNGGASEPGTEDPLILRFLGPEFAKSRANLLALQEQLRHATGPLTDAERARIAQAVGWMRVGCNNLQLSVGASLSETIEMTLEKGERSREAVTARIISLVEAVTCESDKYSFATITPDKAKHFDQEKLFGIKVDGAFPGAREDIREAGTCLALGLDTSAVFHLMRAAEWGLRRIARSVGVTSIGKNKKPIVYANWLDVIKAIDARIEQLQNDKPTRSRARKLVHLADLNGHVRSFKDAWRNEIMHSRTTYGPEQAMILFVHVRGFMQRLATGPV